MGKSKTKAIFECQNCGAQRPKWEGRCSDCGAWNSLTEAQVQKSNSLEQRGWAIGSQAQSKSIAAKSLNETFDEIQTFRQPTGIEELDRVLGGGVVPGSFVLLGGDPGIGKSTLLLQMAGALGSKKQKVIYLSGEESLSQTGLRAQRIGIREKTVQIASENNLELIIELARKTKPDLLVVDSIQTVYLPSISSAPGSVSQVRECAGNLMMLAKNENITVLIIGHVTKDGTLAGPKVLEHMVDTVLSFEGDRQYQYRILRALKNRFGPAHEMGIFEMNADGLREIFNPSEIFLEERNESSQGSAIFASMEGTRPLLCEIQALAVSSPMANPRRTTIGLDPHRTHLMIAVLDKFLNLYLSSKDVFINVVGGLKLKEPASDLAVVAALLSSQWDQPLNSKMALFGEIGLTGEVRTVPFADTRLKEALKLGFNEFAVPFSCKKQLSSLLKNSKAKVHWIKHVRDLSQLFSINPKKRASQKSEKPRSSVSFS